MRSWSFTCFSLVLALFQASILGLTGGVMLNVAVEQGTTINITTSSSTNTQCKICMRLQNQLLCQSNVLLRSGTLLDFSCSQPEKAIIVQITRDIGKTTIEPKDHSAFLQFNRTFIWNLKPLATRPLQLNFSSTGLRQIEPTDSCPDKHGYMLTVENFSVGKFCQNGAIRQFDVRNAGKLSVEVTGGQRLDMKVITVSVGRFMNSLVNVHVVLPERSSTQDFITPNTIPENAEIMWLFSVPNTYYTDVRILKNTVPTCLQPESIPTMKYTWQGRDPLLKRMNEIQPSVEPGNFNLSIQNCKLSLPQLPSKILMVHFQISAIKRTKGQCEGDLPDKQILQIRVMKKDPKSICVLKLDSVIMDTVTIASGNHFVLNTFDCNKDELELTVNQTVECKEWGNCASTRFPLTFYYEQQCIQGVLKTITWLLHGPVSSAVELQSPTDGLHYCLPEDPCNSILQLNVSHVTNPGVTVGQFCPKGSIQKIQIRESKIAVTTTVSSFSDKSVATKPILTYSFTKGISESYTFTVAPETDNPTMLVTPAWPSAMKPSSTVSWIVNVEPQFKSTLKFRNVSQPKCKEVHTNIAVQTIRSQTVLFSTTNKDKIQDLLVPESFFLNMTNCKSPTGAFRAMMEITVQSNTNKLLGVILGVVGVVLVIIAAVVIWFIVRKKKTKKKAPAVSVYNPSEHAFLPGLHGIPKTQEEDEDPHTYAYIDDTLVYSHLLNDNTENKPQIEDIRDYGNKPPLPDRPDRKVENHTEDQALIHNELYGYVQGQSTKSGSTKTSEEGTYETRICV